MKPVKPCIGLLLLLFAVCADVQGQQIGKYIPIAAGSEADHSITEINAATDPAQKLALLDKFAAGPGQGEMALVANEMYVNYYLAQKNYDKAFEYGDKLFALDPDKKGALLWMTNAAPPPPPFSPVPSRYWRGCPWTSASRDGRRPGSASSSPAPPRLKRRPPPSSPAPSTSRRGCSWS